VPKKEKKKKKKKLSKKQTPGFSAQTDGLKKNQKKKKKSWKGSGLWENSKNHSEHARKQERALIKSQESCEKKIALVAE